VIRLTTCRWVITGTHFVIWVCLEWNLGSFKGCQSKDELLPIEMYIDGEDSNLIEFMQSFIGLQDWISSWKILRGLHQLPCHTTSNGWYGLLLWQKGKVALSLW
jgi:hypothetical protein